MSCFFQTSRAINKADLIRLMTLVRSTALLLTAPFGLPSSVLPSLGETTSLADYKSIFQQWQEGLARRIYSLKGYDADQICCSIKQYVEIKKDPEV